MIKLFSPIMKRYQWEARTCMLTQLYGENKNRLFYGPKGHGGVDFKTKARWKYKRDNRVPTGWVESERTPEEAMGRIPIVACHKGTLSTILYDNKQKMGWGVKVTADPFTDDRGTTWQYYTLYWHIETPWRSLRQFRWKDAIKSISDLIKIFNNKRVNRGAIIAIGGNNGKSTGPHLHLSLRRRYKDPSGKWTRWEEIDPMPHFADRETVYHRYYGPGFSDWFYQGTQVSREQVNEIFKSI